LRILALLPDAFGGHGGIARYNRHLLTALCNEPRVERVVAIVRWMPNPPEGLLPAELTYETAAVRGWPYYVWKTLAHSVRGRRFDLIVCGHIHLIPLAVVASKVLHAQVVLVIHGIEAWKPSTRTLVNRMLSCVTAVIAVSEHTRGRFLAWSGLPRETVRLVPNAIREQLFGAGPKDANLARRFGLTGRAVLLTLGRLAANERTKGFDEVMETLPRLARRIPEIVYVIAGEGDDKPRLQRKARALGIADRVVFTGMVREEEKADLYRLADVYVMPSRGEGFGIVLLEAMACGVPVVASKIDGSREAVRNGELGLLVDPDDPAEIEAAVLESLSRPREVPVGLEYFSFERFRQRLGRALDRLENWEQS
jgi:glycosyltransferase involved in cell wall biosynthesis